MKQKLFENVGGNVFVPRKEEISPGSHASATPDDLSQAVVTSVNPKNTEWIARAIGAEPMDGWKVVATIKDKNGRQWAVDTDNMAWPMGVGNIDRSMGKQLPHTIRVPKVGKPWSPSGGIGY